MLYATHACVLQHSFPQSLKCQADAARVSSERGLHIFFFPLCSKRHHSSLGIKENLNTALFHVKGWASLVHSWLQHFVWMVKREEKKDMRHLLWRIWRKSRASVQRSNGSRHFLHYILPCEPTQCQTTETSQQASSTMKCFAVCLSKWPKSIKGVHISSLTAIKK